MDKIKKCYSKIFKKSLTPIKTKKVNVKKTTKKSK